MLNEQEAIKEISAKLSEQLARFETISTSTDRLMMDMANFETKYEMPYFMYFARHHRQAHQKEKSEMIVHIESALNTLVKSTLGDNYSITFYHIKRLLFSIQKDGKEVCRFSLVNKSYGYLHNVIRDEETYRTKVASAETVLTEVEGHLFVIRARDDHYTALTKNYWKIVKEVKSFKEALLVTFSPRKLKEGIESARKGLQESYAQTEAQIQQQKNMIGYLHEQYAFSVEVIAEIEPFFREYSYEETDKSTFYV